MLLFRTETPTIYASVCTTEGKKKSSLLYGLLLFRSWLKAVLRGLIKITTIGGCLCDLHLFKDSRLLSRQRADLSSGLDRTATPKRQRTKFVTKRGLTAQMKEDGDALEQGLVSPVTSFLIKLLKWLSSKLFVHHYFCISCL